MAKFLVLLRYSMISSAVAVRSSSFRSPMSALPYTSARKRRRLVSSTEYWNSLSSFRNILKSVMHLSPFFSIIWIRR